MYIRTSTSLRRLCDQARAEGLLALDVEFIRERSYIPKLALIQIAVSDTCAIVDPLAVQDLSPLFELVTSPQPLKVLHAAGQDMDVLYWQTGKPPAGIFDTQIAAAIVGLGEQLSYSNLVERLLGVSLTKSQSYSDWLQRPLSPEQLEYALNDARYLLGLHKRLSRRLHSMGRTAWAEEECSKFNLLERYQREPHTLFYRIRGGASLSPQGQAILYELAVWRDREAHELDCPPGSVVHDDPLVQIARMAPRTLEDLQRLRRLPSRLLERSAAALLHTVQRGLTLAEGEHPQHNRGHRPSETERVMVKVLDTCLKALCAREKLPAAFTATRRDLERLVHHYRQGCVMASGSPLLKGWREELVGRHLLAVLEGRVSVALDPRSGKLICAPRTP